MLDFRRKWPEIATSLENWHLNQRYVSLPAWRYDFFTWLSFLACFSSTLALPAWHYYSMRNIDSNILFSTLFYHWATSFLRYNFCVFLRNVFVATIPRKRDQKENEGRNSPKKKTTKKKWLSMLHVVGWHERIGWHQMSGKCIVGVAFIFTSKLNFRNSRFKCFQRFSIATSEKKIVKFCQKYIYIYF